MKVNLTDIRLCRTAAGYPKVTFTVSLGENDEAGEFVPKFQTEAWTLYQSLKKPDARGVKETFIKLPQVPLIAKVGPGLFKRAGYITAQACDETMLAAIHEHLMSIPKVQKYMGGARTEYTREKTELKNSGVFDG